MLTMRARKTGDRIELEFPFSYALVNFVKALPDRKYNAGTKTWSVPLKDSINTVAMLSERGFSVDEDVVHESMKDQRAAREAEALAKLDDVPFESPLPLRDYQRVGVKFLLQVESGLLGDDMGLGKTIQSLAVAEAIDAKKVLIFTPASVKWQWRDEIRKFIESDRRTVVIHGTTKKRAELWHDDDYLGW